MAWATDIHLDHAGESARWRFCLAVEEQADALVVTDDIAESHTLGTALTDLATRTEWPVYFVLGNHDFYRGSIAATCRQVGYLVSDTKGLVYFPPARTTRITNGSGFIAGPDLALLPAVEPPVGR